VKTRIVRVVREDDSLVLVELGGTTVESHLEGTVVEIEGEEALRDATDGTVLARYRRIRDNESLALWDILGGEGELLSSFASLEDECTDGAGSDPSERFGVLGEGVCVVRLGRKPPKTCGVSGGARRGRAVEEARRVAEGCGGSVVIPDDPTVSIPTDGTGAWVQAWVRVDPDKPPQ
jgi:hypothetical protein